MKLVPSLNNNMASETANRNSRTIMKQNEQHKQQSNKNENTNSSSKNNSN
jgi:hypothetical protein